MDRDCRDAIVRSRAGAECRVQRAIGIEPGDAGARRAIREQELAADEDFTVRLESERNRDVIQRRGIGVVEGSVAVQSGDVITSDSVEQLEPPDHDDASVALQRQRLNQAVLVEKGVKRA